MYDVCDLACGTGAFLEHLVAAGVRPARYMGLDISQAVIAAAQAKHGTAAFALHDILQDPAPAAAPFDYVVAHIPSRPLSLKPGCGGSWNLL